MTDITVLYFDVSPRSSVHSLTGVELEKEVASLRTHCTMSESGPVEAADDCQRLYLFQNDLRFTVPLCDHFPLGKKNLRV